MLKKLLKYDLKWCYKPLVVFYALAIFFAIITRIVEQFNDSFVFLIVDKICSGITIAMLFNILINNLMRIWVRFIRNIYKDESYLTHTLPAKRSTIYISKILTAIITTITSCIVIVLSIAICCLTKESWDYLKSALESSAVYFDCSTFSLVATLIVTIFFEILFMVMSGIFGITVGYKTNNLRLVKSIITGFFSYMIASGLSLVMLYVAGLFNVDIMNLFSAGAEFGAQTIKNVLWCGIILYIIYNIIFYLAGKRILTKGVNVE